MEISTAIFLNASPAVARSLAFHFQQNLNAYMKYRENRETIGNDFYENERESEAKKCAIAQ